MQRFKSACTTRAIQKADTSKILGDKLGAKSGDAVEPGAPLGPFLLIGTREAKELLIEKARSDRRACHEAGSPGSQPWRPGLLFNCAAHGCALPKRPKTVDTSGGKGRREVRRENLQHQSKQERWHFKSAQRA